MSETMGFITGTVHFEGSFTDKTTSKYDTTEKRRFSVKLEDSEKNRDSLQKIAEAIMVSGTKFAPKWVDEGKNPEYLNFKSNYDYLVFDNAGGIIPLDKQNELITPSTKIGVAFKVKDGVLYATAIKVIETAAPFNPFLNM